MHALLIIDEEVRWGDEASSGSPYNRTKSWLWYSGYSATVLARP